jgi:hypothetical protein
MCLLLHVYITFYFLKIIAHPVGKYNHKIKKVLHRKDYSHIAVDFSAKIRYNTLVKGGDLFVRPKTHLSFAGRVHSG